VRVKHTELRFGAIGYGCEVSARLLPVGPFELDAYCLPALLEGDVELGGDSAEGGEDEIGGV